MVSRKHRKRRERPHHTAAAWLARLTGSDGKGAIQLPPNFALWILAGLLAHLDRRGDSYLADLAAGALIHGGSLTVHDDARGARGGALPPGGPSGDRSGLCRPRPPPRPAAGQRRVGAVEQGRSGVYGPLRRAE